MEVVFSILTPVLVIAISLYYDNLKSRRRRADLRSIAAEMGLSFHSEDRGLTLKQQMSTFSLLHKVSFLELGNIMSGKMDSLDWKLFDIRFKFEGHRTNHLCSIFLIENPKASLPDFTLRRESPLLQKIKRLTTKDRTLFDGHKAFSNKHELQGEAEDEIREMFAPEVQQYFIDNPRFTVEAKDNFLYISHFGTELLPIAHHYEKYIARCMEIAKLFYLHTTDPF